MLADVYKADFAQPLTERMDRHAYRFARRLNFKKYSKPFLSRLAFPVPETYCTGLSAREILAQCQERSSLLIKPVNGKNSWGVHGLINADSDRWFSVQLKTEMTSDRLAALLEEEAARRGLEPGWMAEELLRDPDGTYTPIRDVKIYTFYSGVVALILHKNNAGRGPSYRWRNPNWEPVDTGKYTNRLDVDLPAPKDAAVYTELARAISPWILWPFARIDLYETANGPVAGELTLKPGSPEQFDEATQQYLRRHWFAARERLLRDLGGPRVKLVAETYRRLTDAYAW